MALCLVCGCGALAPDGNPVGVLPSSGAGPYRPLDDPSPLFADRAASLDDPLLVRDPAGGDAFTLYFTRRGDDTTTTIGRARFASLEDPDPVVDTALSAGAPWENGAVSQPALLDLDGTRTLLCYTTGADAHGLSAIGCALSDGGGPFRKADGPARHPAPEFTAPLSAPALLRLDDDHVRLLLLSEEHLVACDATAAASATNRAGLFDGSTSFPGFDGDASPRLGRSSARTAMLSTGRRRFDLFLTRTGALRSLGFAASFDGQRFTSGAAPLLPATAPEEWSPSALAYRDGTLLAYARSLGRHSAIYAAVAP